MEAITYQPKAQRALRKMTRKTANLIMGKIEAYAINPESQKNNVIRLKGDEALRMRVGDWRIFMDDMGNILDVLDVKARGSAYKK